MFQESLIVITEICDGKLDELRTALDDIGADPGGNRWIPFKECQAIHYARWAILKEDGNFPAQLVFATDFDMPLEGRLPGQGHLSELVRVGWDGLDRVYQCCKGYRESGAARGKEHLLEKYLLKHRVMPQARYQGAHHRIRPQITDEAGLRQRVQAFVDNALARNGNGGLDPAALVKSVTKFVESDPHLRGMLTPPETPTLAHQLWNAATATVRFLGEVPRLAVLLPLSPLLLIDEYRRGDNWNPKPQGHVDEEAKRHLRNEDLNIQNQMTFLTEIRTDIYPHWLWAWVLRSVLAWIDLRCRVWDVKGRLGRGLSNQDGSGVPTIHFCQWLIIDKGRRLLFLTNYDGSFERYLDDFMDFNGVGVNGIWGSSRGYPPTRFLFLLSRVTKPRPITSRDIKAFFRGNQLETQVWYSAYPELTVTNINETSDWRRKLVSVESSGDAAAVLGGL